MPDYVPPWRKTKREKQVEKPSVEAAEARGWWQLKIMLANRDGYPDRIFFRRGRYVWIEFKRPDGPLRELQVIRHTEMLELGMEVYTADSEEDTMRILEGDLDEV